MEGWIEEERQGILNTEPPPSTPYLEVGGNDVVAEVAHPTEAPEQPPPIDAGEEAIVSNPPQNVDELANKVTSGFIGGATLINLK